MELNLSNAPICDAAFKRKQKWNIHIRVVHEGIKPFKCTTCDANFTRKQNLNMHIATHHGGIKPS